MTTISYIYRKIDNKFLNGIFILPSCILISSSPGRKSIGNDKSCVFPTAGCCSGIEGELRCCRSGTVPRTIP